MVFFKTLKDEFLQNILVHQNKYKASYKGWKFINNGYRRYAANNNNINNKIDTFGTYEFFKLYI